ncbi:MAG: CotH kinase family protein [Anaerolineae bacterium]|nr:CotH kinase family protein [Anaerolineae bacterium]
MRVNLKRHHMLLVLLVLIVAALVVGLGDRRIIAYTVQGSGEVVTRGVDYGSNVTLFDDTVVHTIQVLISDTDYQQMITTYQETGEKDYFHADVIIDGVRVNNVGVRLKGNASLMTALGPGRGAALGGGGGRFPRGGNMPHFDPQNPPEPGEMPNPFGEGDSPPFPPGEQQMPNPFGGGGRPARPGGQMPEGEDIPFQPPDGAPGGQPLGNFPGGNTSWTQGSGDAKLPLMIKFNEFVSGQTYQGYSNLAIRTYGTSYDAAMLQEPVTNYLFRLAGLPVTETAYVGVRINDEAEELYTLSEVINQDYLAKHFANPNGVLYKAEVGATLGYAGEDPSAYAERFTQQTRIHDADMAPLIAFTHFLSESDEATFGRELPAHLDVDAFATYLAINTLLANADSIIGMNNNYYLYYDDVSERFTLLMWDANESLGKMGGSRAVEYDLYPTGQQAMRGPGGGTNNLVERFLSNDTFKALYETKLQQVYQQAFASGAITRQIGVYADLVRDANQERELVATEAYEQAVASTLQFVAQRTAYLDSTPLLGEQAGTSR